MEKKELISIIIPYYKKKFFFEETLKSISGQSYKYFEILIVYDDKDKSELNYVKNLIKKFENLQIKLIINENNLGAGLSRNKAINLSKGELIAFCDADDIWQKDKLKTQIKIINEKRVEFLHSDYDIIDSKSNIIGSFTAPKIITKNELIKSCDIGLSSVLISKNLLNKFQFSGLKTKEDYLLWLQIIEDINIFFSINKKLISWRKTDNSLSSNLFQKFNDAFKLYNNHLKLNLFYSIFCVIRLTFYAFKKKIFMYF